MPRNLRLLVFLALCLTPLGGLAWLTHHPDAKILAQAREWPVVGPVASWFREQYLPSNQTLEDKADHSLGHSSGHSSGHSAPPSVKGVELGAVDRVQDSPHLSLGTRIWLLPNTSLHREPQASAPVLYRVESVSAAVELEHRGRWYRVRFQGIEGWAYLENYDPNRDPPYGEAPEPPRPVASLAPDPEQLSLARRFLGRRQWEGQLGSYKLYTNSKDSVLLDYLHAIALQVESAYIARYNRRPLGSPREAVVLYASEIPYRLLESRSNRLRGLHSSGFNHSGLVVFYVGGRYRDELSATLIHEIAHLLNRRALGPVLPPWLDEGLADDLGYARVAPDGTLDPATLAVTRSKSAGQVRIVGALSALRLLEQAREEGRFLSLAELTALDWDEFVRSDRINFHYAISSFFVRYLLQAEGGRLAVPFRAFLEDVAAGLPAEGEALRIRLGKEWRELDMGFKKWLRKFVKEMGK